MKKQLYGIWASFLTHFGNIRISKYPPFLYYDTVDYKITGKNIEKIENTLKYGDIILRGYDSYLDGKFIPDPLKFSHGAIYIGNNKIIHAVAEGVSEIHLYDFCQCDRIAIFRPKRGIRNAIKSAKKYLKDNTPYDFSFSNSNSALYCFELCALCYPSLDIKMKEISKLFGLIKKTSYLAQSFFESKDLKLIYHHNPRFNIYQN